MFTKVKQLIKSAWWLGCNRSAKDEMCRQLWVSSFYVGSSHSWAPVCICIQPVGQIFRGCFLSHYMTILFTHSLHHYSVITGTLCFLELCVLEVASLPVEHLFCYLIVGLLVKQEQVCLALPSPLLPLSSFSSFSSHFLDLSSPPILRTGFCLFFCSLFSSGSWAQGLMHTK